MIKNWNELDKKAFEAFLNHAEQLFELSDVIDDNTDEDETDNNLEDIELTNI